MEENYKKVVYLLVGLALAGLSCARSTTLIRGGEAARLLANEESLFTPQSFTCEEMWDCRRGRLTLAVFNRDEGGELGGNFQWIVRDKNRGGRRMPETWNVILLDSPEGERGQEPTREKLEEIEASQLIPVVILDGEKMIRAVVYKPAALGLNAFARPDGTIRLEFGRRTMDRGNILYTFEIK